MFTGIAAAMGNVRSLARRGDDALMEIDTRLDLEDVRIGDSICVSGACLTVTALRRGGFTADVSAETLSHTTLGGAKAGTPVNLEKALRVGDRLGGHIVQGHIDSMGRIVAKTVRSQMLLFCFEIELHLARYVVAKGSIAVDGISLTVNRCEKNRFYVNIIPHTAAGTTLGVKEAPDPVNIETDILARHLEKLIRVGEEEKTGKGNPAGRLDMDLLAKHGFLK